MEIIIFPTKEHNQYKQALFAGKDVWTSRIGKELGRYKVGQIYQSEFGINLQVMEVNREKFSAKHPNYKNLTAYQKKQLYRAKIYDHVRLRPMNKKRGFVEA